MSDDLRAWLEQVRDERNQAQVALQSGDPAPMKRWALEYGHLLVAKCEDLAWALEMCRPIVQQYTREATGVPVIETVEYALRAPGGATDSR